MSARADFRLPPLRFLVPFGFFALLILTHLFASHTSDTYAQHSRAGYERVKSVVGLGSDGMPFWRSGDMREGSGAEWAQRQKQEELLLAGEGNSTKANAAFAYLARNSDVWDVVSAMSSLLDRCPKCRQYPWVFLNDVDFDETFKKHTSSIATAPCYYGKVPREHWDVPSWIDEDKAAKARQQMVDDKVIYGGSVSYRKMCRYQSGFFYRHELLAPYDYYWRIDPAVQFFCDIDYDPFMLMHEKGAKYGFTVTLYEYEATIKTLWDTTKEFINANPQYLAKPNAMDWISNDKGKTYNRCHFWSNFEIGSLNFLRSEAYMKYFDHLDKAGGFSYERWGDAPVHSIAAALFLKPEEIHYFKDMGYKHNPFLTCPPNAGEKGGPRCSCNPKDENNFYDHWYSCSNQWRKLYPDS